MFGVERLADGGSWKCGRVIGGCLRRSVRTWGDVVVQSVVSLIALWYPSSMVGISVQPIALYVFSHPVLLYGI